MALNLAGSKQNECQSDSGYITIDICRKTIPLFKIMFIVIAFIAMNILSLLVRKNSWVCPGVQYLDKTALRLWYR
jgi:hypothetical protein